MSEPVTTPAAASPAPADQKLETAVTNGNAPVNTPSTAPLPDCKPIEPAQLTPDQEAKYSDVLASVGAFTDIPTTTAKDAPTSPITDDERMWLTRECLLRYLRACKWNTADALKRLLGTLVWRREYGVEELTSEHISPEQETGKLCIFGYDNAARPCLYMNPSKQNTEKSDRQVQHLVFFLERVIDIMVPRQETLSLVINYKNSSSGSNPNLGQGRQVLHILQTHYPERLGRALIINIPWFVWGFYKLITPFIDPLTREKLRFNEDLRLHVPPQQLMSSVGGDAEFEYDHAMYWPALLKLAEEKRAVWKDRWIAGGKHIGELEDYLRGGIEKGLMGPVDAQQSSEPKVRVPAPKNNEKKAEVVPSVEALKIEN